VTWLKSEIEKDKKSLELEKKKMIDSLKEFKKEEIIKTEEKLTLWMKIKKVMTGS
jgi:uncharacterized protein YacL (UPF0231 family)